MMCRLHDGGMGCRQSIKITALIAAIYIIIMPGLVAHPPSPSYADIIIVRTALGVCPPVATYLPSPA